MPPLPTADSNLSTVQSQIWHGSLPLEIRLAAADCRTYDDSDPYLIQYPRLSYLAFLLPKLHAFFAASLIDPTAAFSDAWLSFDDVPLKWHYPLGLLYDLFAGAEPARGQPKGLAGAGDDGAAPDARDKSIPWRLTIHMTDFPFDHVLPLDAEGRRMRDAFTNAVKEADFIRNGTARTVMMMSKEDSDNLWTAVETHNLPLYHAINNKLLRPPGVEIRHVPIKVYLPTSSSITTTSSPTHPALNPPPSTSEEPAASAAGHGHIRVVQSLVPLHLPSPSASTRQQPQTLGTALNALLPTIFPSRRNPLLAQPVLHGAVVPMSAVLEELGKAGSYADGFLHVVIVMLG